MAAAPELVSPLVVLDKLLARHVSNSQLTAPPQHWGERAYFTNFFGLDNEENFAKIPCLNDALVAEAVPPFCLVRYRGMVQDIFDHECYTMYVHDRPAQEGPNQAPERLLTTKYREVLPSPGPGRVLQELPVAERGVVYCVPMPGETAWSRAAGRSQSSFPAATSGGLPTQSKRSRESDVMVEQPAAANQSLRARVAEQPEDGSCPPPPVPGAVRSRAAAVARQQPNADEFGLNFPLPEEEIRGKGYSTACIVKLYDEDAEALRSGQLRLCEMIEVLGVLCVNPELASFDAAAGEHSFFADARNPSTALVPRIHALVVRRLPFYHPVLPFSSMWLSEQKLAVALQHRLGAPGAFEAARGSVLALLTNALRGDAAAAEYVLMLLVSRAFAKHEDRSLGTWSLNIIDWPMGEDVAAFTDIIRELVPAAAHLEVTADTLNKRRWHPKKDFDTNRLVSGQLQLAPGTVLVLDETKLAEGQLTAEAFKAAKAITALVEENCLACDFSYMVPIPLELTCIVTSRERSMIKGVDVALPLKPEPSKCLVGAKPSLPEGALDAARFLLAVLTRQPRAVKISEPAERQFGEDFARIRQELGVPTDLVHIWLALARAACLLHGEEELTLPRWQAVFNRECQRLSRCLDKGIVTRP